MAEKKIAAGEARAEFATLVNEVAFGKTRTILTRRGRDIAALVPMEDVLLIRRLEDTIDAKKVAARKGEPKSPIGDIAVRLGLKEPVAHRKAPTRKK